MNRRNQDKMTDAEVLAYLKKHYTYDAECGKLVRRETGRVIKGWYDGVKYLKIDTKPKGQRIVSSYHRAVWAVVYGYLPVVIDHINGDPYDNRLENLREVTYSGNDANRLWRWKPNARTGLPGVFPCHEGFGINVNRQIRFRDKYEAFHALVLLGRMFNAPHTETHV